MCIISKGDIIRSKAISKAILDFIVTSTFFGCCWTWVLTLQLDLGRLRINLWLLLNPLSYIVLAVAALYFYRRTIRMKHEKMVKTNTKSDFAVIITCIGIVTLASIFLAYRTAKWMVDVEPPDTIVGADGMILITVGVINGILIGLVLLTIGYYWLPQNGRKPKE